MIEATLISALALVFILEGLLPFLFPNAWRKMMSEAVKLSEKELRVMGMVSISVGMVVLMFFA